MIKTRNKKPSKKYIDLLESRNVSLSSPYMGSGVLHLHRCKTCSHEWNQTPGIFIVALGCEVCRGNKRSIEKLEKYQKSIDDRLIKVLGSYQDNKTKIDHRCLKCDTVWSSSPYHILRGYGCPNCSGYASTQQTRLDTIEYNRRISDFGIQCIVPFVDTQTKIKHRCSEGHEWCSKPDNILYGGNRCPGCSSSENRSRMELEVFDFIAGIYSGKVESNNRSILDGKELDIYIPDLNLALECNGIYWHSDRMGKGKNYHLGKSTACAERKIRLIHIFENEWVLKKSIVKSRLRNMLGISDRVYARSCLIKPIDNKDKDAFLIESHIQGTCPASVNLGLYLGDELVALMTFGKSRFSKKYEWELIRYCNKLGLSVVGGASRLFKRFIKLYDPGSIVSYSDKRWNTGDLYGILGFSHHHTSPPSYWYFHRSSNLKLESRQKYQKHKLKHILIHFEEKESEIRNMYENGYNRIWDCGNEVYVWIKPSNPNNLGII